MKGTENTLDDGAQKSSALLKTVLMQRWASLQDAKHTPPEFSDSFDAQLLAYYSEIKTKPRYAHSLIAIKNGIEASIRNGLGWRDAIQTLSRLNAQIFGEVIRYARERRRLSQLELAEASLLNVSFVSSLENGYSPLSPLTTTSHLWLRFAEPLEVTRATLVTVAGQADRVTSPERLLGLYLAGIRKNLDYSRRKLAEDVHTDESLIISLEHGLLPLATATTSQLVRDVVKALGLTQETLDVDLLVSLSMQEADSMKKAS